MLKVLIDILWSIAIILLLGGGIYFSIKLKFPQFMWKKMFKGFKNNSTKKISPFKSLTIALAARIGVGSLAGIALAIYIGGPGSIFWIWISGIITSVSAYCESYLGLKYQEKDQDNYIGGPSYYIEKGLGNKKLSKTYAILIIISYIFGFMTIQANTIAVSINEYYDISKIVIGIILTILTTFSIIKGLDRIANITSKLVPIMGIFYIILSTTIIILNLNKIPSVIELIITSAFNLKSFFSGFLPTLIIGIQKGVFSSEAGLGTGSIASSCITSKDKVNLSLIQILGIYFTIFIICTSTAFIILTSNYNVLELTNVNGIEITLYALNYHLGKIGIIVLIISIISLAFSTIVAGYYYGENSLKYLLKEKSTKLIPLLKLLTIVLLLLGSIISATLLWNIVDVLVAILAIINMYSLIKLRKEIIFDYFNKR